jgi:hypothetical protein
MARQRFPLLITFIFSTGRALKATETSFLISWLQSLHLVLWQILCFRLMLLQFFVFSEGTRRLIYVKHFQRLWLPQHGISQTSSVFAKRDAPQNVSAGNGQVPLTVPALCAVSYNSFSQLCFNRVTIENAKKRYGWFPAAGGPEINNIDTKVIYPLQFNSVPTKQAWRKQHVYERNKSQMPIF